MKILMQIIVSAFLGISPVLGAELSENNVDKSVKKPTAFIQHVMEDGNRIIVTIGGTATPIPPEVEARTAPLGWEMNDPKLYGQEKVKVQVPWGENMLLKDYLKHRQVGYTLLKEGKINRLDGKEYPDIDLPVGKIYDTSHQYLYSRPDGTEYKQTDSVSQAIVQAVYGEKIITEEAGLFQLPANTPVSVVKKIIETGKELEETAGEVLYQLILKNTMVPRGMIDACYYHDEELQLSFKKIGTSEKRHWRIHYEAREYRKEIFKQLGGKEILYSSQPGQLLVKEINRDNLKERKNSPDCSQLPSNAQVVSQFPS